MRFTVDTFYKDKNVFTKEITCSEFPTSQDSQIMHIVAISRGILNACEMCDHDTIRVEITHSNDLNFIYNRVGESYFINHTTGDIVMTTALSTG